MWYVNIKQPNTPNTTPFTVSILPQTQRPTLSSPTFKMPSMKLLALSTILSGALASTINLNGVRPHSSPLKFPLTSNRTNAPTAGEPTPLATTPRSTAASAHPSSTTTRASAASTTPIASPAAAALSVAIPATNVSPSAPPQRTISALFLSLHALQRFHSPLATTRNKFRLLPSRF